MREKVLNDIVKLAISDPDFRRDLYTDSKQAITNRGIQLEEDELRQLESLDKKNLEAFSEELEDRLSKGCIFGYSDCGDNPKTPKAEG